MELQEKSEIKQIPVVDHKWLFMYNSVDGLVVCHLPFGPTAYFTLYNVVMRHDVPDIGTMSEAFPHLIFHNFTSQLGQRVSKLVLHLLLITYY